MNSISFADQSTCFLLSVVLGLGIGVLYDFFRIIRIASFECYIVIFLEDVLFCIISAITTFIFVLIVNEGIIRWYVLCGEIIGFIIYYNTIGTIIYRCAKVIIGFIRSVIKFILKPFKILFNFIIKYCKKIIKYCYKTSRNYFQFILKKCRIDMLHEKIKKKQKSLKQHAQFKAVLEPEKQIKRILLK